MSRKSTSISQEEIRFLLKDFPCDNKDCGQEKSYEAPFIRYPASGDGTLKRESLTRQIRRLFEASLLDKL